MYSPSMLFLLSFFIALPPFSAGEFGLTQNLNKQQRVSILKVLGLGSAGKSVSSPQGLGVDHGLEVSLANEFINTESISQYLDGDRSKNTLYYPKIYIGKGIYEHLDLFIHFIPYTATLGLSEFGGTIRLHFLNAKTSPLSISTIFGMNSANFNNELTLRTVNADLSLGLNWTFYSLFTSIGVADVNGTFVGGTNGTTDSLVNETEQTSHLHFSIGSVFRYNIYFMALALDRYSDSVYTIKIGCHF